MNNKDAIMRAKLTDSVERMKERIEDMQIGSGFRNTLLAGIIIYLLIAAILGYMWSSEPESFSVSQNTQEIAAEIGVKPVI
jgi:hypothetical protein